jgi:hypothetical protein
MKFFQINNLGTGQLTNIPVFDISYYPKERGPYNFDVNSIIIVLELMDPMVNFISRNKMGRNNENINNQ